MSAITRRDVENVLRTVFLQKRCIECDKSQAGSLSCTTLNCKAGTACTLLPESCNQCAHVDCLPVSSDPTVPQSASKGPNVGAIAGGVVGGVVFVAIVTFIIWKYCLKGKRRQMDQSEWQESDEMDNVQEKAANDFASRRSTRASTHTVASMASSVLTRASNIIQIAYIPGVTNRSGPGSPDLLVPPVPPIPAMSPSTALSSPYSASEQHFFVPDFRDSMASDTTGARSSYARTSIAPSLARASMASTMYRQNAIVSPLPAQTIVRGKAAVVSVKSNGSNSPADSPGETTPPVPQIDPKHTAQPIRVQMPGMGSGSSLTRDHSIRSTAQLGGVRALHITKKKATPDRTPPRSSGSESTDRTLVSPEPLVPPPRPLTEVSIVSSDDGISHARARRTITDVDSDSDSDEDDHFRARKSLLRNSASIRDSDLSDLSDAPSSVQSPFADSSSTFDRPTLERHLSNGSALRPPMTPIVEESSKRGSRVSKRTQSPFSDDNRSDL